MADIGLYTDTLNEAKTLFIDVKQITSVKSVMLN